MYADVYSRMGVYSLECSFIVLCMSAYLNKISGKPTNPVGTGSVTVKGFTHNKHL